MFFLATNIKSEMKETDICYVTSLFQVYFYVRCIQCCFKVWDLILKNEYF